MAEDESSGLACSNVRNGLDSLLRRLEPSSFELWITGENNFRFNVYPEYKANRIHVPKPRWLEACRDYLVNVHEAKVSEGCEADDMLGIIQTQSNDNGIETIIASPDKDLMMIPGWHYIPELSRKGQIVREQRRCFVSPNEGAKFFYTQLLTGDPTDNIKGVRGIGKVKANELLDDIDIEGDLFRRVREEYNCDEELELNARCLWIQRSPNEDIRERWSTLFGYERMD
jgi:5'-3' exonuclease